MAASSIPASPGVQRLWLLDQLGLRSAYNIAAAWRVGHPVEPDRIRIALDTLADRHAMLRAGLHHSPAGLRFEVSSSARIPIEVAVAGDGTPALADVMAEFALRPFDLTSPPLARALLVPDAPDGAVLALTLHHSVTDGRSLEVLESDLAESLSGASERIVVTGSDLEALRAVAERQLDVGASSEGIKWWTSLLAGLPHCALPVDRPRSARRDGTGRRISAPLPSRSVAAVRKLAEVHRCPPFAIGLAVTHALVARFTGNLRPVVGTVVANRPDRETAGLVGFLANTVVLPGDLTDPALSFSDLVRSVRRTVFDALEHQDVPFDRIVAALPGDVDTSRNPLTEVVFMAQEQRPAIAPLSHLAIEYAPAKFDLALALSLPAGPASDGEVSALFSADVLDEASVRTILEAFGTLVTAAAADPGRRVAALPMAATLDAISILTPTSGAGSTGTPAPVHRLFSRQAARTPGKTAVVDHVESVTYGELDRRSDDLAQALTGSGVGLGDVVGVHLPLGVKQTAAMLAVWKAGGAALPLDPDLPAARVEAMVADSDAKQIIDEHWLAGLTSSGVSGSVPPLCADLPDVAYVLFTSGSSGRPKGVAVSHSALTGFCVAALHAVPQQDVVGAVASPSFDISLVETIAPLTVGRTVVAADRRKDWFAGFDAVRWLQLTPSHARLLLRDDRARSVLSRLDTLALIGERLTPELADQLTRLVPGQVVNCYGPTEATVWATTHALAADGAVVVPIGRPLANTTAMVLDSRGDPVPRGAIGELYLGGTGIALGYLGRPGLTAERFLPDPFGAPGARRYGTGDKVRVRADGTLEYLGRDDTQLKVRGHRIEAGELESLLLAQDGVAAVAVDLRTIADGDEILLAYLVQNHATAESVISDRPGTAALERRLRSELARRVPVALIPAAFVFLPALPMTASRKVDRAALRETPLPTQERRSPRQTGNAWEQELVRLWAELTGAAPDLDGHFFDIGGSSLLLARFHAVLEARFPDVGLTMIDLFVATTLAATADLIADRSGGLEKEPTLDYAV